MKAKIVPSFKYKDCISCSICVQACPVSVLELSRFGKSGKYKNNFPQLIDAKGCIGCKQCETSCPMDCISMAAYYEG